MEAFKPVREVINTVILELVFQKCSFLGGGFKGQKGVFEGFNPYLPSNAIGGIVMKFG